MEIAETFVLTSDDIIKKHFPKYSSVAEEQVHQCRQVSPRLQNESSELP